jgi:hypothetical protein
LAGAPEIVTAPIGMLVPVAFVPLNVYVPPTPAKPVLKSIVTVAKAGSEIMNNAHKTVSIAIRLMRLAKTTVLFIASSS